MKVLATQTICGITNSLTKNDDEFVVRFNTKGARDAFAQWLTALQADAKRSSTERYETARRQMDSADPSQIE